MAVFILEDALSVWTNLGKHLLFVWLFVSGIKTGKGRIIRLDKLFSVVRRSRRITEYNSSRRIMRLVPVFILETNNQTNNKCLAKLVQTDNASSSIKTAILKYYYLGRKAARVGFGSIIKFFYNFLVAMGRKIRLRATSYCSRSRLLYSGGTS